MKNLSQDVQKIKQACIQQIGITEDEMKSKKRKKNIILCRQVYFFLLKKHFKKLNHTLVGRDLNTARTNVNFGIKKIEGYIEIGDRSIIKLIDKIEKQIRCD